MGWRCKGRTKPSEEEPGEGEIGFFTGLRAPFPTLSEAGEGSWKPTWAGRTRRQTQEGAREPAHWGLISMPVPPPPKAD